MDITNIVKNELPESETIEFKDKRADHDSIAKELVSLANTEGGILILGVQEEDGSIVGLQNIENRSDREEGIQNAIAEKVEPRIRVTFSDEIVDECQLLGMKVDSDDILHSIEINSRPVFPIRQGSRIDYLHGYELHQRLSSQTPTEEVLQQSDAGDESAESGYDFSMATDWVGGVTRSGSLESPSPRSPPNYSSPDNRLLTEVPERTIVLFGKTGIDPITLDTITYQPETNISVQSAADLGQIIERASELLDANVQRDFYYAIQHNQRQIVGRHLENFLQDSGRINELVGRMAPGSSQPSDPRPTGIIITPCSGGLLWIKVEWRDGGFRGTRGKCGLLLPNIPVNQEPIKAFFDTVGSLPAVFDQNSRIQHLHLNANLLLNNPEPVHLKSQLDSVYTEVAADNPFYQQPEALAEAFESPIPERYCDAITSVNRFVSDVGGGWVQTDEEFRLTDIEILALETIPPVYMVDTISFATE